MTLYVVELRTRGWAVGISHSPEERVITTIFRLSKAQKNRLQYLKVKFYRALDRYSVMTLGDKYIVPEKHLPEIEREFQEVFAEFKQLRKEIHDELMSRWSEIESKLKKYAKEHEIPPERIERLKPNSSEENFLEMYYIVTPLALSISQLINVSEEMERLAKERDEYRALAERLRREAWRMVEEVKMKYQQKVNELNSLIERMKSKLKEQSKEIYRLRLKAREIADDAKEIAEFLGPETVEDLKAKLEMLKEYFSSNASHFWERGGVEGPARPAHAMGTAVLASLLSCLLGSCWAWR